MLVGGQAFSKELQNTWFKEAATLHGWTMYPQVSSLYLAGSKSKIPHHSELLEISLFVPHNTHSEYLANMLDILCSLCRRDTCISK